jgi:DNA-binding NarL/FixJ family response regulator
MTARTPVFVVADGSLAARVETILRPDPGLDVTVVDVAALPTLAAEADRPMVLLAVSPSVTARVLDQLRALSRPASVILLTAVPQEMWTSRARRSGVRAVLRRDASAEELVAAVAATRAGLLAVHPEAVSRAPAPSALAAGEAGPLTPRELEILEMLAEGTSNRAIASRLKISRYTVKFHVASILAKLGAGSRTEAVTLGVRRGLIAL